MLALGTADHRLDRYLLRAAARELLSAHFVSTPSAMKDFLTLPPAATAIMDYTRWQQCLWDCFGERQFSPLAVDPDDIYEMPS